MLNELYTLSDSLEKAGIKPKTYHEDYKELPKRICIRICISENGTVHIKDSIDPAAIRKYGNNQGTFPAFNIEQLYLLKGNQQDLAKIKEKILKDPSPENVKELEKFCTEDMDNWKDEKAKNHIDGCQKQSIELLKQIQQYDCNKNKTYVDNRQSVEALVDLFSKICQASFRDALKTSIFENLRNRENGEESFELLFKHGNAGSVSIVVDHEYGVHPEVATPQMTEWINEALLTSNGCQQTGQDKEQDAFGSPYAYSDELKTMPSVKVEALDAVILRTMFGEQKCQKRYSVTDGESYPLSKQNRDSVKRALEWISGKDNENKTWSKIGDKEIVFAYPSSLPPMEEVQMKYVRHLAQVNKDRFEKSSEDFLLAFDGIPPENKPDNIIFFILRKNDRARTRIVYTYNCSPISLINSAAEWEKGCRNIPPLFAEQSVPFPADIAKIINSACKRDGKSAKRIDRVKAHQGISVLLEPQDELKLSYYLHVLLANAANLISFGGNNAPRRTNIVQKEIVQKEIVQKKISDICSVAGLILYKCGYHTSEYVEQTAYLIGQLLKVSDELHAMYCRVVRDGDIPPQLAGNSVFMIASRTPTKALALLGQRMRPYISWAKQYRTKDIRYDSDDEELKSNRDKESWMAGWYLNLYEDTVKNLSIPPETVQFGDFDKAQMFIGYLAKFPKRERRDTAKPPDGIIKIDTKEANSI